MRVDFAIIPHLSIYYYFKCQYWDHKLRADRDDHMLVGPTQPLLSATYATQQTIYHTPSRLYEYEFSFKESHKKRKKNLET